MSSIFDYDRVEEDARKKIASKAKSTGNESLEDLADMEDPKKKHEKRVNMRVVRQIMDSCLEKYEMGEYTWKVAIDDICEALKDLL